MELNKFEFKVLKYVNRHHSGISQASLFRKYKRYKKYPIAKAFDHLLSDGYVTVDRVPYYGDTCADIPASDETQITVDDRGFLEIESQQWFDVKYFVSALVVPITVGVVSSLITALFLALFA